MMKVKYDKEVDILVVTFSDNPVVDSDEEKLGVILDYDEHGFIVSIEILDASKRVSNPEKVDIISPDTVES